MAEENIQESLRNGIILHYGITSPELRVFDSLTKQANEGIITNARIFAFKAHESTAHMYDKIKPYSVHLEMVAQYGRKYISLIPKELQPYVIAACYTHDTIEDTRHTLNDVVNVCGEVIGEITYALTNEKGRNRAERGNEKYYQGIRETEGATFVKLCDRLANVKYSLEHGSSMLKKYKEEQPKFKERLWDEKYKVMFDELDSMFQENPVMSHFD